MYMTDDSYTLCEKESVKQEIFVFLLNVDKQQTEVNENGVVTQRKVERAPP